MDLEQFSRTRLLFGEAAVTKFSQSRVAVMGLGGVGSYAAEVLVRSGIGQMLLVDFDVIERSNLNRQLPALHSTLGRKKTEVTKERFLDINPAVAVEIYDGFCSGENCSILIQNKDFVVDAIDSLSAKVSLLEACFTSGIPVISVMGAASRFDPAKIRQADISQTSICPLARRVRKLLRSRGIEQGIPVIYSCEEPVREFPAAAAAGTRQGILGSVAYLTGIMGMWAASYVLRKLAEI